MDLDFSTFFGSNQEARAHAQRMSKQMGIPYTFGQSNGKWYARPQFTNESGGVSEGDYNMEFGGLDDFGGGYGGGGWGGDGGTATQTDSGEYTVEQLAGMTGMNANEFWNGKEFDYGGQRFRVVDTGKGTRQIVPMGGGQSNKVPTADDIIGAQMSRIKEQVNFLKDYTGKNPFSFDEVLARQMAQEKYKPYYTEVLSDFVNPLKEKIARSESDQTKVLAELTRQTDYGKLKMNRELEDALDIAKEGLAGSGLLEGGVGRRYLAKKDITGKDAINDFTAGMGYQMDYKKTMGERERADAQTAIDQRQRDIFGTGREFDTKVNQELETQKGIAQTNYSKKLLEALTSNYGTPMADISQFIS